MTWASIVQSALLLAGCGALSGASGDEALDERGQRRALSPTIIANESYAGLIDGIELAATYAPHGREFVGRIRNESNTALCEFSVRFFVDDERELQRPIESRPAVIGTLAAGARTTFSIDAPIDRVSAWRAAIDHAECASDSFMQHDRFVGNQTETTHEEREGGEHSREEDVEHHGAEESERDGTVPIGRAISGTHRGLHFDIVFDSRRNLFQGHVSNVTQRTICRSRVEIHARSGDEVIELGPTIPVHLPPGETIHVALSAGKNVLDAYSMHPERSRCR